MRLRALASLRNVDDEMAAKIAEGVGVDLPDALPAARAPIDMPPSDALSIHKTAAAEPKGRMIGILLTDGADGGILAAIQAAAEAAGVAVKTIALRRGGVTLASGERFAVDGQLAGTPSVLFDAVAILAADGSLDVDPAARDFAADAFAHLKAIVATAEAGALLSAAGVTKDDFIFDAATDPEAAVAHAHERLWSRER